MARDRSSLRPYRIRLGISRYRPRHIGVLAIHLGINRPTEGGHADAWQPDAQFRPNWSPIRTKPAHGLGRELVAELPRHGPDRRYLAADVRQSPVRAAVASR